MDVCRKSLAHGWAVWLSTALLGLAPAAAADPLPFETAIPIIAPQPDGVFYLAAPAAAIVQWQGTQPHLVNGATDVLRAVGGRLANWAGDSERPCWRIRAPGGWYRVVATRACAPGREGAVSVSCATGTSRPARVTALLDATGGGTQGVPAVIGEVRLAAGVHLVEFRPQTWVWPDEQLQLADVRLIPADAWRAQERAFGDLARRLQAGDPALAALDAKRRAAADAVTEARQALRQPGFAALTNYNAFLAHDRRVRELPELERRAAACEQTFRETALERLRAADPAALGPAAALRTPCLEAGAAIAAAMTRAYACAPFVPPPADPARPRPLFPTGALDRLPYQPLPANAPIVSLPVPEPPDAAARRARFAARNEPAWLAALCAELQAAFVPGAPGLETFAAHCAAGRHREALEAYRAFFFARLADPARHGAAPENIRFELTAIRGKRDLLFRPSPFVLAHYAAGRAVACARDTLMVGPVGEPGAVNWAPRDLAPPDGATYGRGPSDHPFWKTEAGRLLDRRIAFHRNLRAFPADSEAAKQTGFFLALLYAYAQGGPRAPLDRWCAYLDDYCLNARRDYDDCPADIRAATELEPQPVRCTLTLLRIVLDERPALAADCDAATLARWLLLVVADAPPYTIRARRAEMANWGIMGLCHLQHLAAFLPEFKAMQRVRQETWRLWNANFIQHRALDGENLEAWDFGHNGIDLEYVRHSLPYAPPPAGVDRWERLDFADQLRINARSLLTHLTPGGNYWPAWSAAPDPADMTLRRLLEPGLSPHVRALPLGPVLAEAGARLRVETVLRAGAPPAAGPPPPAAASDLAPYAAMAYLRDSWQPGAACLILQNVVHRSQGQRACARTMYTLTQAERVLAEVHSLAVDGRPDNRYVGLRRTGGKTDFGAGAGRHVVRDRFHTSAGFDVVEAVQNAPYARPRLRDAADNYGLYTPTPDGAEDPGAITNVTATRFVCAVRGEGLYLVGDRLACPADATHTYTQFLSLPTLLPEPGFADRVRVLAAAGATLHEEDEAGRRLRTLLPGLANVTLHFFARQPLAFANQLDKAGVHVRAPSTALAEFQAALARGQPYRTLADRGGRRPVSVRWSATGPHAFVTALYTRPAVATWPESADAELREAAPHAGPEGVTGCRLVTRTGTEVWFQLAPAASAPLAGGPVQARGEALLVVRRAGRVSGILLGGCAPARADGADGAGAWPADCEFAADDAGRLRVVQAIERPIDTVRIRPATDVFTDTVTVTADIPTHDSADIDMRYTVDGSEPTLAAPLLAAPLVLTETTLVKVRPFRKGLTDTPWHFTGTACGRTVSALFRKCAARPARPPPAPLQPGLAWQVYEGDWPTLFTYAGEPGVLAARASGTGAPLLDPGHLATLRTTERAWAVAYTGFLRVPATGVYTFHAPLHLLTPTRDAGYDLRVFVDDEEWFPSPRLHAEHTWSIALAAGFHRLRVACTDYRWKAFRNEYLMPWQPEQMWEGTPVLEISAPALPRQPLPQAWLWGPP